MSQRIFRIFSHPKSLNFAGFAQCSDPSLPVAVRVVTSALQLLDAAGTSRGCWVADGPIQDIAAV